MENDFLRRRHAAYSTPLRTVFALVRQATGEGPVRREQIARGYDNEVYAVTTERGREFIVRIRRHGEVTFAQEAWAIERCREVGVPVPEVLLVGGLEGEDPAEAMVQARLPGRPLSEVEAHLTPAEATRVYGQIGEALGRIHGIRVEGFYRRGAGGGWDFATWEGLMRSHLDNRAAEAPHLRACGFTEDEVACMLRAIGRYRDGFPSDPVLCHGDFLPQHLFVTGARNLSGVIDFGEFQGAPPVHDLAALSMERPALDLSWLRAGYGNQALFDETFALRLLLHKLGLQMGYLAHYVRQGIAEEAEPMARGLRASLQEWQAREG